MTLAYNSSRHLGGICMETSEKPKIHSTVATVRVPRYGELIASEKRALPQYTNELNKANRLKRESYITLTSKRRTKLKTFNI